MACDRRETLPKFSRWTTLWNQGLIRLLIFPQKISQTNNKMSDKKETICDKVTIIERKCIFKFNSKTFSSIKSVSYEHSVCIIFNWVHHTKRLTRWFLISQRFHYEIKMLINWLPPLKSITYILHNLFV